MVHKRLSATYAGDAKAFGGQVRALRKARGWSQDDLIARSDHAINKKTLQRIELGQSGNADASPANPELRVLIELCRVLDARIVIDLNHPTGFVIRFEPDDGKG